MIIKDKDGTRYSLTKARLNTLDNENYQPNFYIYLSDVKAHEGRSAQLWLGKSGPGNYVRVPVRSDCIGCRRFDAKTMAIIKKAIRSYRVPKSQRNKKKSSSN